jgi:hypothetical protein
MTRIFSVSAIYGVSAIKKGHLGVSAISSTDCTGAAYTVPHKGPVIIIMHQYAYLGHGKTIHAAIQLEAYKIIVDDKSRKTGIGQRRLENIDGYYLPLSMFQGIPYLKIRAPNDKELESLTHIILTSTPSVPKKLGRLALRML